MPPACVCTYKSNSKIESKIEIIAKLPTMASSTNAVPITVLILRLLTFIFLLVSLIVTATDTASTTNDDGSKTKYTFKNFYAYRYLLSVAVIGCAYTLLQIPFAVLSISKGNNSSLVSQFVIFTDLVFTSLFATGVGTGFGITVELKSPFDKTARELGVQDDPEVKDIDKFFDLAHLSTGFLLIATVCMVVMTILSIHAIAKK